MPVGELGDSETPLVKVVETAAPGIPIEKLLPFISMFAITNSALINMLMASRLLYGMSRQEVLPPILGRVHKGRQTPYASILFTTLIAFGLIIVVTQRAEGKIIAALGGTTALLLLGVFTIVNICVLILRKEPDQPAQLVAPSVLPIIGAIACAFFVGPWTGRDTLQYTIAGWLLALGVVLWALTWMANRGLRARKTYIRDPEELGSDHDVVN